MISLTPNLTNEFPFLQWNLLKYVEFLWIPASVFRLCIPNQWLVCVYTYMGVYIYMYWADLTLVAFFVLWLLKLLLWNLSCFRVLHIWPLWPSENNLNPFELHFLSVMWGVLVWRLCCKLQKPILSEAKNWKVFWPDILHVFVHQHGLSWPFRADISGCFPWALVFWLFIVFGQ